MVRPLCRFAGYRDNQHLYGQKEGACLRRAGWYRRVSISGSAASAATDSPARSTTGRYGNRGALGRRRAVRGLNRSHPTTPVSVVARPLYEHRISLFTALPTRCLLGNWVLARWFARTAIALRR